LLDSNLAEIGDIAVPVVCGRSAKVRTPLLSRAGIDSEPCVGLPLQRIIPQLIRAP